MPAPSSVDAVVLDLDGVLVDSEELRDEVLRGLAAADGRPLREGATRVMQGMGTPAWSDDLVQPVGVPAPAAAVLGGPADLTVEQAAA